MLELVDKRLNHVWVVCYLGSAASLCLTPPPTTTGSWVARKYVPYTSQLGTCMGLGFGGVMLLLDNTAVPPAEQCVS